MNSDLAIKADYDLDIALVMCPAWGIDQPPVGISYLKGFLKERGIRVRCFDFSFDLYKDFSDKNYWDLNFPEYFTEPLLFDKHVALFLKPFINKWASQILSQKPRVVGFSLFMSSSMASLLLAKELKKINPGQVIIGGGPEATRIKRIMFDNIRRFAALDQDIITGKTFDILLDGEGEEALAELHSLLSQGKDFHSIDGALYAENGKVTVNKPRGLLKDLDILPCADYDDYQLAGYKRASMPLVTSRGCINRCAFCADSPLWKIYRYCSAGRAIKEIRHIIERYHKNEFEIMDSTFNGDIKRVAAICDLIIGSRLDIRWSAKATLSKGMDYRLLEKMKKAGCTSLAYGVESGSAGVLREMCKSNNIGEAKRIIRDTWRAGIQANCFFLIGYPTETEDDFQATLDFIRENSRFIYCFDQVTGCHIEEDSYLGLNVDKYGIIFKEEGWYSRQSTPEIRKSRLQRFRSLARELHKHYQCEVQS